MKRESSGLMKIIGMRIRERRLELHLTQEEASVRCGITQSKLSQYEDGGEKSAKPTLETIEKICYGLDISIVDLLKE